MVYLMARGKETDQCFFSSKQAFVIGGVSGMGVLNRLMANKNWQIKIGEWR